MGLKELYETYPDKFMEYAEKVLDSYFGNIFVTLRNERIIYVNEKLASSVHMRKEDLVGLSLEDLRAKKLWLRSVSQELYEEKREPFNAYNVSKFGNELFTHVEPIFNDENELVMSAQFSIPRQMLQEFSDYINSEKSSFQNYKDISDYLQARREASEQLICQSPAAQLTFRDARYLAGMDSTILIYGETGTGKDVLANYIYQNSKRFDRPFVPVNCSAIPAELMESEFFGYERGAFTGARSSGKPGLFEMADQGTLFLDEIGELPLAMQAKLLRVLESGEVMRVGGTKLLHPDVRVIAATNRDLKKMVEEKQFRADLYYRLNVMPLFLPPLRERREDILPLAEVFLGNNNRKYHLNRTLTPEMQRSLTEYHWPGNIRELRNIVERYVISGRMDLISPSALPPTSPPSVEGQELWQVSLPLHEACQRFEHAYIRRAMDRCGGSVSQAAKELGIHRSLLYKKLKQMEGAASGETAQL